MCPPDDFSADLFNLFQDGKEDGEDSDAIFSDLSSYLDPGESLSNEEDVIESEDTNQATQPDIDKEPLPEWLKNKELSSTDQPFDPDSIEDEDLATFLNGLKIDQPKKTSQEKGNQGSSLSDEFSDWLGGKDLNLEGETSRDSLLGFTDEIEPRSKEEPHQKIPPTPLDSSLFDDIAATNTDLPDWLKSVDLGTVDLPGLSSRSAGGDEFSSIDDVFRLGIEDDWENEKIQEPEQSIEKPHLSKDASAPVIESKREPESIPEDFLADLRFDTLREQAEKKNYESTERIGALKNMSGVIKPEILFEGNTLSVGGLVEEFIISPAQARNMEILKQVFAEEKSQGFKDRGDRSTPIIRIAAALLLIASILLPALLKITVLPEAKVSSSFLAAYDFLEDLPKDARLLFILDYGPEASAELTPLITTILAHALDREANIYLISNHPFGTTLGEEIRLSEPIAQRKISNSDWLNFGYLPGGVNGISSVIAGSMSTVLSPLFTDYLGNRTNLEARSLKELNLDGIYIVSSRFDDSRQWIEQLRLMEDIPLFAVSSTSASPSLSNYAMSGQIDGMVAGIADGVAYQTLRNGGPDEKTLILWNAQAIGGAGAAALILAATVIQLAGVKRKRGGGL